MSASPASGRIKCARCEGLNPEIASFCNRCGAALTVSGPPPAGSPKPPPGVREREPEVVTRAGLAPPTVEPPPGSTAAALGDPVAARGRKICPGCHRFNPANAVFCADCGVGLPKNSAVPLFGGPAGFWIRLVAFVIDGLLIAGVELLLFSRLGLPEVDYDRLPFAEALLQDAPGLALGSAITCLYAMIMVGAWGGTAGKLMLGLRIVRNSDGSKVPYGLALGRSLAEFASMIPVCLGYIWIALSPSKRAWHDYLCDTRVVYARAE